MPQILNQLSNPQRLLLALFFLAVAALNTGSSGGLRFGGDEDEGSGFGGTGKTPAEGSLKPLLGDTGEVRIRFEPNAVVIAEQVVEEDIRWIPGASKILPPVTVVTAPEFAAAHTAEIAITDSIQARLRRDAVIYEHILESVEGYYPSEIDGTSLRTSAPERVSERQSTGTGQRETADTAVEIAAAVVPAAGSDSARITWAELAQYLAGNSSAGKADDILTPEAAENPAAAQRPNRIRRPELPQVQRGRVIRRPAILPPRVQPMRF